MLLAVLVVCAHVTAPSTVRADVRVSQQPSDAPIVGEVIPAAGPTVGGTAVTITGSGFTGVTEVDFGGVAAQPPVFVSDSEITAVAPPGSTGTVDVTVTTPGGTSNTSVADQFTYDPAPTVTAISPAVGPQTGGTPVTITGTGFTSDSAVDFGATAGTKVTVNSANSITADAPAGTGTVNVTVTTPGGTSNTSVADQFTYDPAPTVTAISPAVGPQTGGTPVTITGTGFTSDSTVDFGTNAAAILSTSTTSITADAPTGTGTVDVTVTTPGGTSDTSAADQFTYDPAPTVTAIAPAVGLQAGGTPVAITGTNFRSGSTVAFGLTAGTNVTVNSTTSITADAPGGAGTVDVTVTNVGGTSATSSADQFTYAPPPVVTSISPPVGPLAGGNTVTITGTGFEGATAVSFGSASAESFTLDSSTQITALAPAESGMSTVNVTVTTPVATSTTGSSAEEFTYLPLPAITSVTPADGPTSGGTVVTITGTGFTNASAVMFGQTPAAAWTVVKDTEITATTAAAGAGTVDVAVTTSDGPSEPDPVDKFSYEPQPTVTGITPAAGPLAGGRSVTITGTGFTAGSTVAFGAHPASDVSVLSATQISATSPAGSLGTVDVTVTTPGGTSPTSAADRFTFGSPPTVSTGAASAIKTTSATLTGTVNANGLALASCLFEYGPTDAYGQTASCVPSSTGQGAVQVTAALRTLSPATTYHYRLVATTAAGTTTGSDAAMTTPALGVVGAPLVGLRLERTLHRRGTLGNLLGIHGITGAALNETIVLQCVSACSRPLQLTIKVHSLTIAKRNIRIAPGFPLSRKTRIAITVSAAGKLSRFVRYAFGASSSRFVVKLVASGCVSPTGSITRCPRTS